MIHSQKKVEHRFERARFLTHKDTLKLTLDDELWDVFMGSKSCSQWECFRENPQHYNDVIMSTLMSEITSLTIVYSSVYSDADKKKASKLRVTGLCEGKWPVNSLHKGPVTRKMFPFDDVIMVFLEFQVLFVGRIDSIYFPMLDTPVGREPDISHQCYHGNSLIINPGTACDEKKLIHLLFYIHICTRGLFQYKDGYLIRIRVPTM